MESYDGRLLIGNQRLESGERISVENPATLEIIGEASFASPEDCRLAVEAAGQAFRLWRSLPAERKQRVFLEAKAILFRRADEIARLITLEKGSPLAESLAVEVLSGLEALDYYSHNQKGALRDRKISAHVPFFSHKKNAFFFQPLGPTLIISPWNFPFLIPLCDVLSALAAGNTVVLRPSTSTPFSALVIGEIFLEAGLPAGVLNIVPCRVAQAEELIQNPGVQSVVFTGSVGVGKRIMELASRNLTSLVLELGGKDPMIVLEDADIEAAARGAVWAGFMNTGQSCASIERVYVAARAANKFLDRLLALTQALRVGNPMEPGIDIGPMENAGQLRVVEAHVGEAREKGAEILCGGRRLETLPGYFHLPTVLNRVDHQMKVMTEETFGPVLPVMSFADLDEALGLANDSHYGLTASVWTRDEKKAHWLSERLEVGTVTVNDHMITFTEPKAIWGGIKQTGFGRTHGPYGLLELVNIKYVSADFAGKRDRMWWYPYSQEKLQILENSLRLLHHPRRASRARALLSLIPRLGAVKAGIPFRSLLKVSSRLLR